MCDLRVGDVPMGSGWKVLLNVATAGEEGCPLFLRLVHVSPFHLVISCWSYNYRKSGRGSREQMASDGCICDVPAKTEKSGGGVRT